MPHAFSIEPVQHYMIIFILDAFAALQNAKKTSLITALVNRIMMSILNVTYTEKLTNYEIQFFPFNLITFNCKQNRLIATIQFKIRPKKTCASCNPLMPNFSLRALFFFRTNKFAYLFFFLEKILFTYLLVSYISRSTFRQFSLHHFCFYENIQKICLPLARFFLGFWPCYRKNRFV